MWLLWIVVIMHCTVLYCVNIACIYWQKIEELEGQVTDVMAHLDAVSAVTSNPELQGGQLYIPPDTAASNSKTQGARRKHRK